MLITMSEAFNFFDSFRFFHKYQGPNKYQGSKFPMTVAIILPENRNLRIC